jgi:hypothetical protein
MKIYTIDGGHDRDVKISVKSFVNKCIYNDKEKLMIEKGNIDNYNQNLWNKSKKNINKYEYIYTSSNIKKNICSVLAVSRSYFKLYEMLKYFNLDITICACIAEGPGGFMNCLNEKLNNEVNYGITLISNDRSIPYWNPNLLNNKKNRISLGVDGTGDIYKVKNVKQFVDEIGGHKCNLVTSDGGFDYSSDYNSQEEVSYRLLLCEIFTCLHIQKKGGNFILKIFDLFHYQTVQLIYLLYTCYSKIDIIKPTFSRLSNSEKYLICHDFIGCPDHILTMIQENYENFNNIYIDIPQSFIDNINVYNDKFVTIQINEIQKIIKNMNKYIYEKINKNSYIKDYPTESQIKCAIEWCKLHDLSLNKNCIYLR